MASPVLSELKGRTRGARTFRMIYVAMLLLSLHWAVILYVNSTYLKQFVSNEAIGTLYTIGSALTIIGFLFTSRILRALGNYRLTLGLAAAEFIVLIGLAFADSLRVAIPLFVLHQAIVPLLLFNLDVFTERLIGKDECITGGKRGLVLTIMSIAGAIAPLVSGYLLGNELTPRFVLVYLASAAFLAAFIFVIVRFFKHVSDSPYHDINVLAALRRFWLVRDLRFVFFAHFLLQLFFAWMVIYVPLYLATVIGFSWTDIGIILFVGLTAYIICEYPIGEIADRYIGEKEMMAAGFIILLVSTSYIGFLKAPLIIPWIITMFMTRVGASLVEVTTESYFFKQTNAGDANIIGFFRASRPLAYMLGALFGSLTLLYVDFDYAFLFLGLLMIPGIIFAMLIKDTR